MKSAIAISYELDDVNAACDELIEQISKKLVFEKESVAVLYSQPKIDSKKLSSLLHERLGIPVFGGTTVAAAMLSSEGYLEFSVLLHVMTADDCFFSVAISQSMEGGDTRQTMLNTYEAALNGLKQKAPNEEPKLLFCITSIVQSFAPDDNLSLLTKISSDLPIYGFVAGDDFEFEHQEVFLNNESHKDVMVILLIAGNVKPLFIVKNLASTQNFQKATITKSEANIIYEINSKKASDYMRELSFVTDDSDILWNFQFFVSTPDAENDDGIAYSRALKTMDKETGAVSCFAGVPQGSEIALQYCDDVGVKLTCEQAMEELNEKVAKAEKGNYEYSTALLTSCCLRHAFLAHNADAEGSTISTMIPKSIAASGLYGFGEIAPTSIQGKKAVNRFHNATLTICLL